MECVEVTTNDNATQRASTAAEIVTSREKIERFGDSTAGEVLNPLPGLTICGRPGRSGKIRLRGMRGMGGGCTQILVNRERMPPGFSLDQLLPDQVERIEILRAPRAKYGARAIAGTINMVLREALQKRANIDWTRNDKLDEHGGAYDLTLNAMQNERCDDADTTAVNHSLSNSAHLWPPPSALRPARKTSGSSASNGRSTPACVARRCHPQQRGPLGRKQPFDRLDARAARRVEV